MHADVHICIYAYTHTCIHTYVYILGEAIGTKEDRNKRSDHNAGVYPVLQLGVKLSCGRGREHIL